MKWVVAALAVTLGGCVSVSELESSPETLNVISGKKPQEYATCVQEQLAETRGPLEVEPHHDGLRLVVPQRSVPGLLRWWTSMSVAAAAASSCTSA